MLERVKCVDKTSGESFEFCLLDEEERKQVDRMAHEHQWPRSHWDMERADRAGGWLWQRDLLNEWRGSSKHVSLKARQIGVTWLAAGDALHEALYTPGCHVLVVSIKESEAIKVLVRIWGMLHSLPKHLWNRAKIKKPVRGTPTSSIELEFPNGSVSTIEALTSSPTAGHGTTARLVILDEFARQEYASDTWKAVLPTTQGGGRVEVISTGNGVSIDHGQGTIGGNYFHYIWQNSDEMGMPRRFLAWDLHPDRNDNWYRQHAMPLPSHDRGEQYPRNEREAFILTGTPFFDIEALDYYEQNIQKPLYRLDFKERIRNERVVGAARQITEHGLIRVYKEPDADRSYAIGADVATGRGIDSSTAYVVDLGTMALVAEFHGKLGQDLFATQLHYLGRWYNSALLAVETGGGYGDAVIIPLRDGRAGRPAYPKLYRHQLGTRPNLPTAKPFGFPMTTHTRPLVINQLEKAIREHSLPWTTQRLQGECRTFVHALSNPSPRAQAGCNDDCVMAAAITLEMYRLRGEHPYRRKKKPRSTYKPWLRLGNAA